MAIVTLNSSQSQAWYGLCFAIKIKLTFSYVYNKQSSDILIILYLDKNTSSIYAFFKKLFIKYLHSLSVQQIPESSFALSQHAYFSQFHLTLETYLLLNMRNCNVIFPTISMPWKYLQR